MDDLLNITYNRRKATMLSTSGTVSVIYSQVLPQIDGCDRFNAFYSSIGDACYLYCQSTLLPHLAADLAPKEFSYRLSCKLTTEENTLTVSLTASLTDRSARKKLREHSETHRWNSRASAMVPRGRRGEETRKGETS